MTEVYFVRHAQPDFTVKDAMRPLTHEGIRDSLAVTWALRDRGITYMTASPFTRSRQTIEDLAKTLRLEIDTDEDFRERKRSPEDNDCFPEYWKDFDFHTEGAESLREVQERNLRALNRVLTAHKDEKVVIGTHGTALSTILNHYFPQYGYECFLKIVDLMPFVIRLDFEGEQCKGAQTIFAMHKPFQRETAYTKPYKGADAGG